MWMKREVQLGNAIIEKISLSTLGRDKGPLETLVAQAMEHRIARELNRIAIYVPSPYSNEWTRARLGNNRKLDSVVLRAGQKEAIVGDLTQFFAAHDRYESLGIPWRRGYLLYGPPGTGKTSLVTALASELSLNVCVLSLASPNVTDEKIGNLLATVPRRSIILIEDVDAFFQQRSKADAQVKVSYSGFINALDGVAAHEGSVVFLTTNHPERIDEAAIRSGRVDFRMELGLCDSDQLERMFLKFFDDAEAAAPLRCDGRAGAVVARQRAGAPAEGRPGRGSARCLSRPGAPARRCVVRTPMAERRLLLHDSARKRSRDRRHFEVPRIIFVKAVQGPCAKQGTGRLCHCHTACRSSGEAGTPEAP